jgi:hypothetical protein
MLHYLLKQPDMLTATGFNVMQGQKHIGLEPYYRVSYDVYDKLLYDIEHLSSIDSLLHGLTPMHFLDYTKRYCRF